MTQIRTLDETMPRTSTSKRTASFATLGLLASASIAACAEQSAAASQPHSTTSPVSQPPPLAAASELALGAPVPATTLTLQDGFQLTLPQLKGKVITLFFCADAGAPGCLREARGLADKYSELHEAHHVAMFGVTRQDASSQRAFIAQHKLPYDLVADTDGSIARAFGVPELAGDAPRTFLIDREGSVRMVWRAADPDEHARQILAVAE